MAKPKAKRIRLKLTIQEDARGMFITLGRKVFRLANSQANTTASRKQLRKLVSQYIAERGLLGRKKRAANRKPRAKKGVVDDKVDSKANNKPVESTVSGSTPAASAGPTVVANPNLEVSIRSAIDIANKENDKKLTTGLERLEKQLIANQKESLDQLKVYDQTVNNSILQLTSEQASTVKLLQQPNTPLEKQTKLLAKLVAIEAKIDDLKQGLQGVATDLVDKTADTNTKVGVVIKTAADQTAGERQVLISKLNTLYKNKQEAVSNQTSDAARIAYPAIPPITQYLSGLGVGKYLDGLGLTNADLQVFINIVEATPGLHDSKFIRTLNDVMTRSNTTPITSRQKPDVRTRLNELYKPYISQISAQLQSENNVVRDVVEAHTRPNEPFGDFLARVNASQDVMKRFEDALTQPVGKRAPTFDKELFAQLLFPILKEQFGVRDDDDDVDQTGKGVSGASDQEINELMNVLAPRGFLVAMAYDKLPKLLDMPNLPADFALVVNEDKSGSPGTHWVAIMRTPKTIEYYDSFGRPPMPAISDFMKQLAKKLGGGIQIKINRIPNQSAKSTNCGYLCMRFLTDRYAGKSFKQASGFDSVQKSEADIERWKDSIKEFDTM